MGRIFGDKTKTSENSSSTVDVPPSETYNQKRDTKKNFAITSCTAFPAEAEEMEPLMPEQTDRKSSIKNFFRRKKSCRSPSTDTAVSDVTSILSGGPFRADTMASVYSHTSTASKYDEAKKAAGAIKTYEERGTVFEMIGKKEVSKQEGSRNPLTRRYGRRSENSLSARDDAFSGDRLSRGIESSDKVVPSETMDRDALSPHSHPDSKHEPTKEDDTTVIEQHNLNSKADVKEDEAVKHEQQPSSDRTETIHNSPKVTRMPPHPPIEKNNLALEPQIGRAHV